MGVGDRREKVQSGKQRARKRDGKGRKYELSRWRASGREGGGHGGKRRGKKKREKKRIESPRGGRGDWHSRLVKLWWSRMESAGYLTGGVCEGGEGREARSYRARSVNLNRKYKK